MSGIPIPFLDSRVVAPVDVVADGHDELFRILEGAAADTVLGQVAEETLDHAATRPNLA